MRSLFLPLILIFFVATTHAQFYFRGELKDEQGNGLQGARIALFSKGSYPFFTGNNGVFGIPSSLRTDTVSFMMEGFDTLRMAVNTTAYGQFVLKAARKKKVVPIYLSSYTRNFSYPSIDRYDENDKNRSAYIENTFVKTGNYATTDLALLVNKSSYSNIRRLLKANEKPSADEARIEEMLNFFNIQPRQPEAGKTITFCSQLTDCPWNDQSKLLFINLLATKLNLDKTPPAHLVFLIDASGSMDMPNRLPLIKSGFKLMAENLRPTDKVTIITYGDAVTELMTAVSGEEKQRIIETIEGLRPNGSTPGASAIRLAYAKARENFVPNGNNRIIMATDGDFNVGENNAKNLQEMASRESKAGIFLSCLGVGIQKDDLLEALARAGQGHFAYIDNEMDAEKVLVEEFVQTTSAVAQNVFMSVNFNNSAVKSYRLIGFDNKRASIYNNVTDLYGGETGSGQSLMAAFEVVPTGDAGDVAKIEVSYQRPNQPEVIKEQYQAKQEYLPLTKADRAYRLAATVIAFGQLLQQTDYCRDFSWSQLQQLAATSITPGDLLHQELLELIEKARKIYPAHRKSKLATAD